MCGFVRMVSTRLPIPSARSAEVVSGTSCREHCHNQHNCSNCDSHDVFSTARQALVVKAGSRSTSRMNGARWPGLAPCPLNTYSQLAMQLSSLDMTFHALSDGTRRSMIQALARGEVRSAGDLGRRFGSAQPTISKHLKVLEEAGLVVRRVKGRVHRFRLRRKPLRDAERWLSRHQAFWSGAVTQLDRLLSETDDGS